MSTFAYIAGASAERNINEAIRAEEARSHGAELRNLSYRFQAKLNELYDENKSLREFLDIKDVIIGQQAATIDRQRNKIKEIEEHLEYSKTFILNQNDVITSEDMMKMLMVKEMDNLIGTSLPEIITCVFERHGVEIGEETRNYIKENAKVSLGLSADPKMRAKFYKEFRAELLRVRQPGQTPWTYTDMVDCAIRIAKSVKSQADAIGKTAAAGASAAAAMAQRKSTKGIDDGR